MKKSIFWIRFAYEKVDFLDSLGLVFQLQVSPQPCTLHWLVHCGWLGCPYLGATLSVLSRFILRRSRTSAAIADRSAEAPANSGHRRTTTTLADRCLAAPARSGSSRGHLYRRVLGKTPFSHVFSWHWISFFVISGFRGIGLVFSPSRIRRPEKSGERASEPFSI
jgi:hypothetical protein